jgi:hypothetical protein
MNRFATIRTRRLLGAGTLAALLLAAGTASAAGGKGYTWGKLWHDPTLGIDLVGNGQTGNPYEGDTTCQAALPLLCVRIDGSPRPNYPIDTVDQGLPKEGYRGWIEGHVGTTQPMLGTALVSRKYADQVCAASLGPGWRLAEFHDGRYVRHMDQTRYWGNPTNSPSPWPAATQAGGYDFYAFGNVREDTRYWVRISDQPANCWNP